MESAQPRGAAGLFGSRSLALLSPGAFPLCCGQRQAHVAPSAGGISLMAHPRTVGGYILVHF